MRVFLIGFMGSGKTHWGKTLASQLKIPFFDLDEIITEKEKMLVSEIFVTSGEEYFRMKEKEALEALVEDHTSMVLSCGGGTPCFFNNIDTMKKFGIVVWLNTNVEIILQRLMKEKAKRPLLKNIADQDMKNFIIRKLNERRMYYEQADVTLDNEDSISTNVFIQTILHA
ncbi:MAG: shikimate kinase [Chitinophagaceae bacterium]|nr:shikimate kinase [Chitinophagaceae bacterium]